MARYKKSDFMDEENSSISSIQLTEGVRSSGTYIRYHRGISLWDSRTTLERWMTIMLVVLLAIVMILIGLIVEMQRTQPPYPDDHTYPSNNKTSDLCLSGTCIYTASEVIQALDRKMSPCDDFFEFACGGWIKNNPIPDGKSSWSVFRDIEVQNQLKIRNALEHIDVSNASLKVDDSKAEIKARIFYDSCLDKNETMEALGGEPLLEVIRKIGGWYLLPKTMPTPPVSDWDFQHLIETVQNTYNLGGLFNWAVAEDDRNSSRHVIVIDQGGLNLPTRENYLNKTAHKKILDAYLQYMTSITVLLGANETQARQQMSKVIDFETDLANITTKAEDRRDEEQMYNNMTIAELQVKVPFLNWRHFFNNAFKLVGRKITDEEPVVVYAPEYLTKLDVVMKKYNSEEGKKTLSSYMMWQVSRSLSTYLSKQYRDATKILRKALFGSEGSEEMWRFCVTETNNAFGFAIGAMFVRDVFNGDAKPQAEEMINRIRAAFKENLPHLRWMDSETRQAAEIKADAITDMIGFPDYILDPDELDKQYAELKVRPNEYFQNNLAVNLYTLKDDLEKLDKPVNRTKWGMTPSTVNAYYTPTKNQIVFPAGLLQLPFYDGNNPKCVNYGAMGVVMGHELTHAFDDEGRAYDKNGNLHQWWNNSTIKAFKGRAECMEKQYNKYTMNGEHLNGKNTLGENIADNGGLKAAFHAYTTYADTVGLKETLPGLGFTDRQMFFVSFAQVWCSAQTTEADKVQLEKDEHALAKYRVIGPLANLPEFSKEFNCPLGSNMNPIDKCELW